MRYAIRLVIASGLLGVGYLMGSSHVFLPAFAEQQDELPSEEAIRKIADAYAALKSASQQLQDESRYNSITKTLNPYSILVGGINVKEDLESGKGVDPDTYAALNVIAYDLKNQTKKFAKDENAEDDDLAEWVTEKKNRSESLLTKLGYDNYGRLTYDSKVVKMYSISRLRRLIDQRKVILNMTKERKPTKQK